MKICYLGRKSGRTTPAPRGDGDVLELFWDNWDDFGYKTSFGVSCRVGNELVDLGLIRILAADRQTTHVLLDERLAGGWDGTFPVEGIDYVSVPGEITFYQQLKARIGVEGATEVAQALRDASFLVRIAQDSAALALQKSEGFKTSLLRERGSVTAYMDGWKILESQGIAVQNFEFHFKDVFDATSTLALNFASDSLLPQDINVLIGPNGVGKSRVLHHMVAAWLNPDESEAGFAEQPNLSQVVVVSYSPFERFPVDTKDQDFQDKDVYKYFGFRGRGGANADAPIRLSHTFPKINAAQSLIACAADDKKFNAITDWARKVRTMEEVLRTAFAFDYAAIEISAETTPRSVYLDAAALDVPSVLKTEKHQYIPVSSGNFSQLNVNRLRKACISRSGVAFFEGDKPIELSSGQRLFAYIVINLLGVIRRSSLVLIDEPELFLHPTLEIQFIEMLKEILSSFNSKALLATHSEVIVREIPADCVHVFQRTEDGLSITRPPFQTFGGDIQRISSYVFGDNSVSKPFEKWLRHALREHGSAEDLIEALGSNANEEMVIKIKAMESGHQW